MADGKERQITRPAAPLSIAGPGVVAGPALPGLHPGGMRPAAPIELWLVDIAAGAARRRLVARSVHRARRWLQLAARQPRPAGALQPPTGHGHGAAAGGMPAGPAIQQTEADARRPRDPHLPGPAQERGRCAPVRVLRHARSWCWSTCNGRAAPLSARRRLPGPGVSPGRPLSCWPSACSGRIPTSCRRRASRAVSKCATGTASWCTRWPRCRWWKACRPATTRCPTGVRDISWRADAPATLVWAEAQDGGDPATGDGQGARCGAACRRRRSTTAAGDPGPAGQRYAGIQWGRGDLALLNESLVQDAATYKQWRIAPDQRRRAPELLFAALVEDRYNDPGPPVHGARRQRSLRAC